MSKGKEKAMEENKEVDKSYNLPTFNPRPHQLTTDAQMREYFSDWCVHIGKEIFTELAPKSPKFAEGPDDGGVYFPAQVLAIGAHLPLPSFAREVLAYYQLAPAQLSPGSWRVVLGFGALVKYHQLPFGLDEFRSIYRLQTHNQPERACYFVSRKGKEKLILGVGDSDTGWQNTMVIVKGPWESADPREQGQVPRTWSTTGKCLTLCTTIITTP